jgi:hypothetical protein
MIGHYDADLFGKANFPFRLTNFYVAPDMVKEKLAFEGAKNSLETDLKWYFEGYQARGGPTINIVDSKTSFDVGSIYDKYDPLEIDVSGAQGLSQE